MSLQHDIDWYREGERDHDFLVHLVDDLDAELSAPWHVGAFIDVDGLTVGPHMVRSYRARIAKLEAELAVAIELVTMARQTFDADGNGLRFLSEIRDDVLKDVNRLAEKSTS